MEAQKIQGSANLSGEGIRAEASGRTAEPEKRDVSRFEEALRTKPLGNGRTSEGSESGIERKTEGKNALSDLFSWENRTLDGSSLAAMPREAQTLGLSSAHPTGEAVSASMPLEDSALENLVSRILVGSPEKGGSEVRITLSDRLLPNTEISLTRDNSGLLSVKMTTGDPAAFQTLVGSRGELLARLSAAEAAPVSVSIHESERGADDQNPNRESRGRVDYYPEGD